MFDWLKNILSAIWEFIEEFWEIILIVIIIVICIWFPALIPVIWGVIQTVWGWIVTAAVGVAEFFAALGLEGALAAALGIGMLLDPEGVIGAIAGGVSEVGGTILDKLLDSPVGMVGAAVLGVWGLSLLMGDDDDNQQSPAPAEGSFAKSYSELESSSTQRTATQPAVVEINRNREGDL